MFEQYFGTKSMTNDHFIVDSILEHTMIDEEELYLLKTMLSDLSNGSYDSIDATREKIIAIRNDSNHIFEHIEEQIIQANFDFQKQYDFLRIFQRMESVSAEIICCANYIAIFTRLEGQLPKFCFDDFNTLINRNIETHEFFKKSLMIYEKNKQDVFNLIHKVISVNQSINTIYFNSIETMYRIANEGSLKLGDMRSIENIYNSLINIGNSIEAASTSLEWLLIS